MKVRLAVGIGLGMLVAGLVSPGVARACEVFTTFSENVSSGPPDSQVLLSGAAFDQMPVDVYWGSVGGPLMVEVTPAMADTNDPKSFSNIPVTIPADAIAGKSYFIQATDHVGQVSSVPVTFTVTAASPAPTPTAVPTAPPTANPTSAPTALATSAPASSSASAPSGATAAHGSGSAARSSGTVANSGTTAAAPDATVTAPASQPPVVRPAPHRPGSPSAAPGLGKPVHGVTDTSTGLPAPVVLGLVLAGLSVLGAAGFGAVVLPRRRRAHAHGAGTAFDEDVAG